MKKLFLILAASAMGFCLAIAAPDMPRPFTFASTVIATNDSANTAGSAVTSAYVNAWVDAVVLDWTDSGGALSQTATVSVASQGGTGSGPSRTIITLTAIACSDNVYYPRATAVSTAGAALATLVGERIPLVQDAIVVSVYDKTQTNTVALTARVIITPSP